MKLIPDDELYKTLFESNKSIMLLINPKNGDIINANKSAIDFYGYEKEKLLSMKITDINVASENKIKEEMNNVKSSNRTYFKFVHKLANNELRNVEVTSTSTTYLDEPVLFSVINDVTKEYKLKEELLKREEELKGFFELSINLQVLTDLEGKILQINNASKDMLGYEKDELIGRTFLDLVHKEDIQKTIEELGKLSEGKDVNFFENRAMHKDGSFIHLAWSATTNSSNNLVYATAQNTTKVKLVELEKEEKEKLLLQQSKMAIMGEMIGNIAHQWKQPLNLISLSNGTFEIYQETEGFISKEELKESIENIKVATEHLNTTIDDFRNFFIPNKEKVFFTIKSIYTKAYRLINSQFKNNNIEIFDDISDIELEGLPNELLQVLINLIKNSKDELINKNKEKRKLIFVTSYKKNNKVYLKVKDNAGGIPNNIISKIFNAYFTTKNSDKGTGIGLYMSKQIIENMRGTISVSNISYTYENIEYLGAEFTICLDV